ncbi:MAG: hypothetical protein LBQ65_09940 [Tannerellaceae bacterium]|jgi:hypothetical protein|nr:hypothetical protein [Tannerellaceae bacterium]
MILGLVAMMASCGTSKKSATATALEANRDRREVLLAEVKRKAIREARKEASGLKKEGYKAFVGDLPIDRQIENTRLKAVDINDLGYPHYIVGSAFVTGGNMTAAKSQALHAAKLEIASLTSSMVASLIESSIANNELSSQESASLNKHLQATKELIVADFGQVNKDLEIYRELPNKNIQILIRLSYNLDQALEAAKRRMVKEMEGDTQALHQKLDKVFNLDRIQPQSNTNIETTE